MKHTIHSVLYKAKGSNRANMNLGLKVAKDPYALLNTCLTVSATKWMAPNESHASLEWYAWNSSFPSGLDLYLPQQSVVVFLLLHLTLQLPPITLIDSSACEIKEKEDSMSTSTELWLHMMGSSVQCAHGIWGQSPPLSYYNNHELACWRSVFVCHPLIASVTNHKFADPTSSNMVPWL